MSEFSLKQMKIDIISSIMAGICIGLAGTVYLTLKNSFPGGNVVGAIFFTLGLYFILTRGYALFTGQVPRLIDDYLIANSKFYGFLGWIWVGNFIGTFIVGVIEYQTHIFPVLREAASEIAQVKITSTWHDLLLLGFLCNIMIYFAVNGFAKHDHIELKLLSLFFGVSTFVICGFEHSVADMYYFVISDYLVMHPGPTMKALLFVTIGNILGGTFVPVMIHFAKYNSKE